MNDFLKPKIKELALKHKLTQSQIEEIFYSQFKFAAKVMSEDSEKDVNERRDIKIRGIGTFKVNKRKIKYITENGRTRKRMAQSTPEDGERAGTIEGLQ